MVRTLAILAILLTLCGCATAGPLSFSCDGFEQGNGTDRPFAQIPPPSKLEGEIHSGEAQALALDPLNIYFDRYFERRVTAQSVRPEGWFLLSGGGQWGAFGAGFLNELHERGELPRPVGITGISTGALQALVLGGAEGAERSGRLQGVASAYSSMLSAYAPPKESAIVNRHPFLLAIVTGSVAGLKPLRALMNNVVCPDADLSAGTPCLIDDLKALDMPVLIGFVNAHSGQFEYVDAVSITQRAPSRKVARECLVGAALASSAMPVFLQQVRIGGNTYYDGGVRESVFQARIAAAAERARLRRQSLDGTATPPAAMPIYVIRNGPTREAALGEEDSDPNKNADALTAAMRAEPIIVNQIEVGSIAALRLEDSEGEIRLITADGWNTATACPMKPHGVMFDPTFMRCLQRLGRAKADVDRAKRWILLSPIIPSTAPNSVTPSS